MKTESLSFPCKESMEHFTNRNPRSMTFRCAHKDKFIADWECEDCPKHQVIIDGRFVPVSELEDEDV